MNDQSIKPIPPDPPPGSFVYDLTNHDILCGRGSGPNDHIGNINFRDLISHRRQHYLTTSSRAEKARIAIEILNDVRGKHPPGRFLERVPGKGKSNPMWVVVEEDKAMEKIKQALRQIRNRQQSKSPPRPGRQRQNITSMNDMGNMNNMTNITNLSDMNTLGQIDPLTTLKQLNSITAANNMAPSHNSLAINLNQTAQSLMQLETSNYMNPNQNYMTNYNPQSYPYQNPNSRQFQNQQQYQTQQLQNDQLHNQLQNQQFQNQQLQNQLQNQQLQNQQLQNQSHRQKAQQQFQNNLHNETPINELDLQNMMEPQPYSNFASSSNMSAIGNMSVNAVEKLINTLQKENSSETVTNNVSLSDLLPDEIDATTATNSSDNVDSTRTASTSTNSTEGMEAVAFPSPLTKRKNYRRLSSSQSKSSQGDNMMSMDFLASSMGDMSVGDIFTSESSLETNTMTKAQRQMYFKKMSDLSNMSIDQLEKFDPRTINDMLKDTDQDSLRDIGVVLKRLESDDD